MFDDAQVMVYAEHSMMSEADGLLIGEFSGVGLFEDAYSYDDAAKQQARD